MLVPAQYPGSVWDGTSKTRSADDVTNTVASPDGHDWDQLAAEVIATQTQLNSSVPSPGSWTSVGALSNSWTGTIKYRLRGTEVMLTGVATAGTLTDGTTIFTLPSGKRPTNTIALPVCPDAGGTGDANMRVVIASSGTVKCYGLSSTTTIDFSNVRFFTDQ